MTSDGLNGHNRGRKGKLPRGAKLQAELARTRSCIDIERSGDWMPAEELRNAALGALEAGSDVTVNLAGVDHLDASALQILLVLDAEQKRWGRSFNLANSSPQLRYWFEYAGAADRFSMSERKGDE
ncbi:MAG: STAS domain-containing protein [Terracidiphilus sp.]|jgi:anti-anti-sigma regulatory factor